MYKDIDTSTPSPQEHHHQGQQQQQQQQQRLRYTKEQLLALQASPLVSKPASLPPLSSWINCRDTSLSGRSGPNNHTAIGVHNRFIQPKASISTPSSSSHYSKVATTTNSQHWNHRHDQFEGKRHHQYHSGSDAHSNLFDDDSIPEWMDDNPSDLTKDEQTEKMVLDSSQMEEWKLRMKQMDDDKAKKDDNKTSGAYLLAGRDEEQGDDDRVSSSLMAMESLHLSTTHSLDDTGSSYSTKSISVQELFQHQHLPSPPSLSPLPRQQQQSNPSSTISSTTASFLLSPRDDQIGGLGSTLPNQSTVTKQDNGSFMNNSGYMDVTQQERPQQYQRPPPGFMLPSPEHQSRMKLQPNDSLLPSFSPGHFSMASGGDNPRPPPMMTSSFSTGTTGSHHYHPMLHHQSMSMAPPFPILPQQLPSQHQYQQPSSMMLQPSTSQQQQYHRLLQHQQYHHHQFVPPAMHHLHHLHHQQQQQQQLRQHYQTPSFPSQLLHHPYQPQPLVSDMNK